MKPYVEDQQQRFIAYGVIAAVFLGSVSTVIVLICYFVNFKKVRLALDEAYYREKIVQKQR